MLIKNIPLVLQEVEEFQQMMSSLDVELETLNGQIATHLTQQIIMQADESRIAEWESFLMLASTGTLYERRLAILSMLTSTGKLNRDKILEICTIYTSKKVDTYLKDSTIYIDIDFTGITTYNDIKTFGTYNTVKEKYANYNYVKQEETLDTIEKIEAVIEKLKPCHIALNITRYEANYYKILTTETSYQSLKDNYTDYNSVKNAQI